MYVHHNLLLLNFISLWMIKTMMIHQSAEIKDLHTSNVATFTKFVRSFPLDSSLCLCSWILQAACLRLCRWLFRQVYKSLGHIMLRCSRDFHQRPPALLYGEIERVAGFLDESWMPNKLDALK